MGKKLKWRMGLLLFVVIIGGMALVWKHENTQRVAAAGEISDEMKFMIDQAKNADFTIVEIVPFKGMGEIGYGIAGCEPIDLEWACAKGEQGTISSFGNYTKVQPWQITEETYEQWKRIGEEKYGTDKNGTNIWTKKTDQVTGEIFYESSQSYALNGDAFRKNCLPELADGIIQVITVTPAELNAAAAADNYELIKQADLFYLFGKDHQSGDITRLWENYSQEGKNATSASQTFAENDMSWPVTMAIFKKIVTEEDRAALILDVCLYNEMPSSAKKSVTTKQYTRDASGTYKATGFSNGSAMGSSNNVYKLCLMLHQRNPQEFYQIFIRNGLISSKGSYSLQSGDASIYWNPTTFLPAREDGTQANQTDWKAMGINTTGGNNVSVIDNIYTFNGENCLTARLEELNISRKNNSMEENPYVAELFSYLGEDSIAAACPAEAVECILHNRKERKVVPDKTTMKILELEPCKEFTLENSPLVTRLRNYGVKVEIEKQTTAEFIGRLEDLSSVYDMIYVGTNTGGFNTALVNGVTTTQYNDTALNGKKYLHVGDLVNCVGIVKGYALRGLISSGFDGRYRYSGNDITSKKKTELQRYVSAGYPVLLARELYDLNTTAIDDSSYLYAFVKEEKGQTNVQAMDTYNQPYLTTKQHNEMMALVGKAKTKLVITSAPKAYEAVYNNAAKKLEMVYNEEGKKISFQFQVQDGEYADNTSIRYTARLYIDTSGDGSYSEDEVVSTKRNVVPDNEVPINVSLDADYKGVLCWKLVVFRVDNTAVRDEETGVTAIESTTGKEKIKILQITTVEHQFNWTNSTLNLQNEMKNSSSGFYKYINALKDFELTIHTITVDDFKKENAHWNITGDSKTYYRNNMIEDYDMLIFGFGDSYKDIENTQAMLDVQAYIDSGQSVLFTHDTTSQNNQWGRKEQDLKIVTDSGFYFNQFLRTSMGMNRFGVLPVAELPSVAAATERTKYKAAMERISESIKQEKEKGIFDLAAKPSKLSEGTYPEIQGFTYTALMEFTHIPRAMGSSGAGYDVNIKGPYKNLKVNSIGTGEGFIDINKGYATNKVTKVNDGQITEYPYKIPGEITITDTHGQYYQLNMEDPEIVVWYCLSDSQSTGSSKDWYSASPNDVSNNYYIYNKGNITYSGVGHRSIASNENEVKLFINTMIAAYKTSINNPEVVITNGSYVEETDETYLYSNQEAGAVVDSLAVTPITFQASSNSSSVGELYARVYNEAGEDITEQVTLLDTQGNEIALMALTYNGTLERVKPIQASTDVLAKEYTILYPVEEFNTKNRINFTIKVYTKSFASGSAKGALLQYTLFDLD